MFRNRHKRRGRDAWRVRRRSSDANLGECVENRRYRNADVGRGLDPARQGNPQKCLGASWTSNWLVADPAISQFFPFRPVLDTGARSERAFS